MPTCVFYVDESGNINKHNIPLKNGDTPLLTITGLAVSLEDWRSIDREYLNLKSTYYKSEISRSRKRPEHFEIKGNRLTAPRNKDKRREHKYIDEVINLTD
ncbi:MAG: DUF3800 domain-containing protein [Desulfosalsimonas sp.]